jgi:hypothetical protein
MKKRKVNNVGAGLLFLLRQQRYLYHQFKGVAEMEREADNNNSPELMVAAINGRRKLSEKLREVTEKLRPIKANWGDICRQIGPECMSKVRKLSSETEQIIKEISADGPDETERPLYQEMIFEEAAAAAGER